MNCKTCKNSCDCKEREAFEKLDKLGGGLGKCSGYEPYTKTATEITKETKEVFMQELHRLQAENKKLQERNVILRGLVDTQKAEIERLTAVKGHIDTLIYRDCEYPTIESYNEAFQKALARLYDNAKAKAEAYKECIEKVKEKQYLDGVYVVDVKDIDNSLKELVGGT